MMNGSGLSDLNKIPCYCGNSDPHTQDCLSKQNAVKKAIINFNESSSLEKQRIEKYGHINSVKHAMLDGKRHVLVEGKIFQSGATHQNDNIHEFLCAHLIELLGHEWFFNPIHANHPIVFWYNQMCNYMAIQTEKFVEPSAYTCAFMILAYDIFSLKNCFALQEKFIKKLKGTGTNYREFQGIRYELTIYALLIRGGFKLSYLEDRGRGPKRYELTATHKITGQKIDVEAKSLHRKGVLGAEEGKNFNLRPNLNDAMKKPFGHPYFIFVDLNDFPVEGELTESKLHYRIAKIKKEFEKDCKDRLPAEIILTNITHHYAKNYLTLESEVRHSVFFLDFEQSKFNAHPEIIKIIKEALDKYGVIPINFDEF